MTQPPNARIEIGIDNIQMPRPANFLRYKLGGDEEALDVALFTDDTLADLGRRIGEEFVKNAKKRRLQKESPKEKL